MQQIDAIRVLLSELGEAVDQILEVVESGDEPSWGLELEDETILGLDYDAERDSITLTTDLGKPEPEHQAHVYGTLLVYNSLRSDTGGVVMAQAEPGGQLQQIYEVSADGLTLPVLQTVAVNFAEKARVWRELIAAGEAVGSPPEQAGDLSDNTMRV